MSHRDIADAIPPVMMTAAIAGIRPDKGKHRWVRDGDGILTRVEKVYKVDHPKAGDRVMVQGTIQPTSLAEDALVALKDMKKPGRDQGGKYTYSDISAAAGIDIAESLNDAIDLATADSALRPWVDASFTAGGVVFEAQLKTRFESFASDGEKYGFTQALITTVFNIDVIKEPLFPQVTIGRVIKAIRLRAKGEI